MFIYDLVKNYNDFYCGKLCIFLYFYAIIYILLAQQVT